LKNKIQLKEQQAVYEGQDEEEKGYTEIIKYELPSKETIVLRHSNKRYNLKNIWANRIEYNQHHYKHTYKTTKADAFSC